MAVLREFLNHDQLLANLDAAETLRAGHKLTSDGAGHLAWCLGVEALNAHALEEAETHFQTAITADPGCADALIGLIAVECQRKTRNRELRELIVALASIAPAVGKEMKRAPHQTLQLPFHVIYEYRRTVTVPDDVRLLAVSHALQQNVDSLATRFLNELENPLTPAALLISARHSLAHKDAHAALETLSLIGSDTRPLHCDQQIQFARAYSLLGKERHAQAALNIAFESASRPATKLLIHRMLGTLYSRAGHISAALCAYQAALAFTTVGSPIYAAVEKDIAALLARQATTTLEPEGGLGNEPLEERIEREDWRFDDDQAA